MWKNGILVVTASESHSVLELESKSLLNSGWWNEMATSPCDWLGVTCNVAGSVTEISLRSTYGTERKILDKLNFTCLPNLIHLDL